MRVEIAFSLLTSVSIKGCVLCLRNGETCSGGMFGNYVTSKTFNFYEAWYKKTSCEIMTRIEWDGA
jgi:hypothetical protein